MVFDRYAMNLRETLKKFGGRNVGINCAAVQRYSRQLLVALKHLASLRVVHADIKPDNILVSEDFRTLKLCDFGSAFRETDSEAVPTPYLVSRFYRAPEVTLGLEYNRQSTYVQSGEEKTNAPLPLGDFFFSLVFFHPIQQQSTHPPTVSSSLVPLIPIRSQLSDFFHPPHR
jgi:serine/threonine protein kinase